MNTIFNNILRFPLSDIPFVFLVLIIAFAAHEFSHAYLADKFGDPTSRLMGRVTLNPRVHIDPFGMILFLVAGFGWAKPVLVNSSFFKHPRRMGIIVSVAGPLSNVVLVFLTMFVYGLLDQWQVFAMMNHGLSSAVYLFFNYMIFLNLVLFLFNLIPLPPLDGYRILHDLLPVNVSAKLKQYEQWAIYFFLLFLFIPQLARLFFGPLFGLSQPIITFFGYLLHFIFHNFSY